MQRAARRRFALLLVGVEQVLGVVRAAGTARCCERSVANPLVTSAVARRSSDGPAIRRERRLLRRRAEQRALLLKVERVQPRRDGAANGRADGVVQHALGQLRCPLRKAVAQHVGGQRVRLRRLRDAQLLSSGRCQLDALIEDWRD